MSPLVAAALVLLSAEPPKCEFVSDAKDARGCVSVRTLEKALETGCALVLPVCFSVPVVELPLPRIRISVSGKGATATKAKSLCAKAGVQFGVKGAECVVGAVSPSDEPFEAQLERVDD